MSNGQERIVRLIQRQKALVEAGQNLEPSTVSQLLDYMKRHSLLDNPTVRSWLISLPEQCVFFPRLLEYVLPMEDAGFRDDAIRLFRTVLFLDNPKRRLQFHGSGGWRMLLLAAMEHVMSREGLLSTNPNTWGKVAVESFASVLSQREAEWNADLASMRTYLSREERSECPDEHGGDVAPDYDSYWNRTFFEDQIHSHEPYYKLANVVRDGLSEAATLEDSSSFDVLTEFLVKTKWGLALSLPLVVLHDDLREADRTKEWHYHTAFKLILNPLIVEYDSTSQWRRLIRRQLTGNLSESDKARVLHSIRSANIGDFQRLQELADIQDWSLLTDNETREIEEARENEGIYGARDPREVAQNVPPPTFQEEESVVERRLGPWPYPEDKGYLELLIRPRNESGSIDLSDLEADLVARCEALETVLSRPEIEQTPWLGESLGWCADAVRALKKWASLKKEAESESKEICLGEYMDLLNKYFPCWSARAKKALEVLQQVVPDYHKEQDTDSIVWSASDPLYQAITFLGELLAAPLGEPLDTYRDQLATVVQSRWPRWPAFTRATLLTVLRLYNWNTIPGLGEILRNAISYDVDPLVLRAAFHRVVWLTFPDRVRQARKLLKRATSPGHEELLGDIGQFTGGAIARLCTERDSSELEEARQLYEEVKQLAAPVVLKAAGAVLWGAAWYLQQAEALTDEHAEAVCGIARWAIDTKLAYAEGEDKVGQELQSLRMASECKWSEQQRRFITEELETSLERILWEGGLGDFTQIHYRFPFLFGEHEGAEDRERAAKVAELGSPMPDELLLKLCTASAERVAQWRKRGKTTSDLGYIRAVSGECTEHLIRSAFEGAANRKYMRRELPSITDILADAGLTQVATRLRIYMRQH